MYNPKTPISSQVHWFTNKFLPTSWTSFWNEFRRYWILSSFWKNL